MNGWFYDLGESRRNRHELVLIRLALRLVFVKTIAEFSAAQ